MLAGLAAKRGFARRWADAHELTRFVRNECRDHVLGTLPNNQSDNQKGDA